MSPPQPSASEPTAAELTRPFRQVAASAPVEDIPEAVPATTQFEIRRGPGAGSVFAITGTSTTLGRNRDCDIVLDDVTVSRHHATVRREEDGYVISDTGSLNGIYVNQQPTEQNALADGDEVWIGKFRLTFRTTVS